MSGKLTIGTVSASSGMEMDNKQVLSLSGDLNSSVDRTNYIERVTDVVNFINNQTITVNATPGLSAFYDKPIVSSQHKVFPKYRLDREINGDGFVEKRYINNDSNDVQYPYSFFTSNFNSTERSTSYFESETGGVPDKIGNALDALENAKDYSRTKIDVTIIRPDNYKFHPGNRRFFGGHGYLPNGNASPDILAEGTTFDDQGNITSLETFNDVWGKGSADDVTNPWQWQIRVCKERDTKFFKNVSSDYSSNGVVVEVLNANDIFVSGILTGLATSQNTPTINPSDPTIFDYEAGNWGSNDFKWIMGPNAKYISQYLTNPENIHNYITRDALVEFGVITEKYQRVCNYSFGLPVILDLSGMGLSSKHLTDLGEVNDDQSVKLFDDDGNLLNLDPSRDVDSNLFRSCIFFSMTKSSSDAQVDKDRRIPQFKDLSYGNGTVYLYSENMLTDLSGVGVNVVGTKHIFNHQDWANSRSSEAEETIPDMNGFIARMTKDFFNLGIGVQEDDITTENDTAGFITYISSFENSNFYDGYHASGNYSSMNDLDKVTHIQKVFLMMTGFGNYIEQITGKRTWSAAGFWYALNYGRNAPNVNPADNDPADNESAAKANFNVSEYTPAKDQSGNMEFYEETGAISIVNKKPTGGTRFEHSINTYEVVYDDNGDIDQSQTGYEHNFDFTQIGENIVAGDSMFSITQFGFQEKEEISLNTKYHSLKNKSSFGIKSSLDIIKENLSLKLGRDLTDDAKSVRPAVYKDFRKTSKFGKKL